MPVQGRTCQFRAETIVLKAATPRPSCCPGEALGCSWMLGTVSISWIEALLGFLTQLVGPFSKFKGEPSPALATTQPEMSCQVCST